MENHPDYVVLIDNYGNGKSLDNYHGGFSFERKWIREQTFMTPCGFSLSSCPVHAPVSGTGRRTVSGRSGKGGDSGLPL